MKNKNNYYGQSILFGSKFPKGLQIFSEGDGGGDGDGGGSGASVSFDDFLKQEGNQAEFDRRVQKAIQTAVSNAQQKWKSMNDDSLSEAERLAKMTKEEKSEYELQKLKKELADMRKRNELSDMAKTARKMLSEEDINIPDDLLSHLVSSDADSTKAAVESFASLFKAEVKKAVAEVLKGEPPKKGGSAALTKEQIMAVKNRAERQKLINENMHLFTGGN